MAKRQYIVGRRDGIKSGQSEMELAALMRERLGLDIAPEKLREFVCDRFTILSILCHEIHEADKA